MQPQVKSSAKGGGKPNRGGNEKRGPKPSPWGMSPEELAAKNAPKNKDVTAKANS